MIEICDASGKSLVRGDLLENDGVSYQPSNSVELIARVTNRSSATTFAVLTVRFPTDQELEQALLPAEKLLPTLRKVLDEELRPNITIEKNQVKITGDKSLRELAKDWVNKKLQLKFTVSGVALDASSVKLVFEDPTPAFPAGSLAVELTSKRPIKIKKLIADVTIPEPVFTVRFGLTLLNGLTVQPLDFVVPALEKDFSASVGMKLFGIDVKNELTQKIESALDSEKTKRALLWVRDRIENAMQMGGLRDVSISSKGIRFEYDPKPPEFPAPAVMTTPKSKSDRLEHLIIVMLENRSFDHMMADVLRGRTDARFVLDGHTEHVGTDTFTRAKTKIDRLTRDPSHDSAHQDMQARGEFVKSFLDDHKDPHDRALASEVLNYQAKENVRFFDFLSREGVICDDWRASLRGHTWPNRLYSLSGASKKIVKLDANKQPFETYRDNPGKDAFELYTLPTICDALEAQHIDWAYYRDDFGFIELYRRWVFDQQRVRSYDMFRNAIQTNKLPKVVWYEPNISDFGKKPGTDDHPPISVLPGQRMLSELYESLRQLETKNWLLAITYDESGGFYDHLPPEAVDDDRERRQGFRVPAFLVSPWLQGGKVCPTRFEHTSLIRTVLDNFCAPEPIFQANKRVRGANGFATILEPGSGFSLDKARDMPMFTGSIPRPDFGDLESVSPPLVQQPLYAAFEAAKQQLADRQAADESMLEGVAVLAAPREVEFEGLYIGTRTLLPDLAAHGWTSEPWFDDALEAHPPTRMPVDVAWDLVHDLRARYPGIVIDPLWATYIDEIDEVEEDVPSAPPPKNWHLDAVKAREAWALTPARGGTTRGQNIVVGHLDTGYLDHEDLQPMLFPQYGWDVYSDDNDPRDDLVAGTFKFPGHGTSTVSIIGSRGIKDEVTGTAPSVSAIPFRISTSVVHMSMRNMTRAIQMAVERDVHVISLSAGGLWSAAVHRAVRDAVDAGVIIVAAAGNYSEIVVWPARFDEVIACGATNHQGNTWRWSNGQRGEHVTVMAPGESVWALRAKGETEIIVDLGSGTSFATACTAGAIANWLGFHGREALIARYGRTNLARIAKQLVRALTVHSDGKAGLLDMKQLLTAKLPDPVALTESVPERTESDPSAELGLESVGTGAIGSYADELVFRETLAKLKGHRTPLLTAESLESVARPDVSFPMSIRLTEALERRRR